MFPILFQYKFLQIGGYGVMLGMGFYLAFLLLERELKLRDINPELAYRILLGAIPGGIVGSKMFHIFEHWSDFTSSWQSAKSMIFSGEGLSAYGGFVLAAIICFIIIRKSGEDFLTVGDAVAPSMALGYCFGRFGCHVAGDGCYGVVSTLGIATPYPNGIVPTTTPVLPTPFFEVYFSFIVFALLMQLRKLDWPVGRIFFLYMILNGLPRFLVEFVRLNPRGPLGLSQAQVIGILLIIGGIAGWIWTGRRKAAAAA